VCLEIAPVDPRSLFRGNYASLAYAVATVDSTLFEGPAQTLRKGEVVYVSLEEGEGQVWRATRVRLEEPPSGLFLRGRLSQTWPGTERPLRVRYGIEAWFAPEAKAVEVEQATRRRRGEGAPVCAVVAVAGSGRAALARLDLP
jgi:uncharacterized membrane-anchored protein